MYVVFTLWSLGEIPLPYILAFMGESMGPFHAFKDDKNNYTSLSASIKTGASIGDERLT